MNGIRGRAAASAFNPTAPKPLRATFNSRSAPQCGIILAIAEAPESLMPLLRSDSTRSDLHCCVARTMPAAPSSSIAVSPKLTSSSAISRGSASASIRAPSSPMWLYDSPSFTRVGHSGSSDANWEGALNGSVDSDGAPVMLMESLALRAVHATESCQVACSGKLRQLYLRR